MLATKVGQLASRHLPDPVMRAGVLLGLSVLCFSATAPFATMTNWGLVYHLFLRSTLALLMAAILIRKFVRWEYLDTNEVLATIFCSLTSPLFVISADLGSPNVAIVLVYSGSTWGVLYAAMFLKQKLSKSFWGSLAYTAAGLAAIFYRLSGTAKLFPALIALAGGMAFGLWSVYHERRPADRPPTDLVSGFMLSTLVFSVLALFHPLPSNAFAFDSWRVVILEGVLVGSAYWCISKTKAVLPPGRALLICTSEIPFAIMWTAVLIKQRPAPEEMIGGALVLYGVWREVFKSGGKSTIAKPPGGSQ